MNDPALADELRLLEEALLTPAVRGDSARLDRLFAADFLEIGSSGRVFDKATAIASLAALREGAPPVALVDFQLRLLTPTVALAVYRVVARPASGEASWSLRSSVWVQRGGRWQLAFHQGTRTPAP